MSRRDLIILLVLIAFAIAFPYMGVPRYLLTSALVMFCFATVVTQWNLVFGVAGIFSLGQLAIFATGAYTTAVMGRYLDMNVWYTFPIAGLAGVGLSLLVGLATLRMKGVYVALLTIAIAQMMFVLIQTDTACSELNRIINPQTCISFTGGSQGLGDFGSFGWREVLGGRDAVRGEYYTMLGLLVAGVLVSFFIINSRIGLGFKALRDNPELAASRGISQFKYQLIVFGASAFLTSVAGSFYVSKFKAVGPSILGFDLLLLLIAMLVVGGLGRAWGPLLGALVITIFREVVDNVMTEGLEWRDIIFGSIVAAVMIFMPEGLTGALDRMWNYVLIKLGFAKARSSTVTAVAQDKKAND